MIYYNIVTIFGFVTVFSIGILVYFKNKKSVINNAWAMLCISASFWSIFYFLTINAQTKESSYLLLKFTDTCAILIAFFWFRFVTIFLDLYKEKKIKQTFHFILLISIIIFALNLSRAFVKDMVPKHIFRYYAEPAIGYNIYVAYFGLVVTYGIILLFRAYRNATAFVANQIRYVIVASLMGFGGGGSVFLLAFNIPVPPYALVLFTTFPLIISYAILKYRLMDIRVAITRTGLFILIYTFVLGLPFVLASNIAWRNRIVVLVGSMWWTVPLGLMAVLATLGPFIYIFLNTKAEERLLKDQRRYQNILKEASLGMTRIRDLRRLLNLITHIVTKSVKISYIGIYLYHRDSDEFLLEVSRDKGRVPIPKLTPDNHLITWINLKRQPLIYEEVKRQAQDSSDPAYKQLEENMRALTAQVVLPSFLEDRFLGFIVLGEKMSGQIYTAEDLNVFQVLASQAALAIENAQFYNEAKEMQLQIAQAEKMATIGTMADGLSHQINNRFYALSLIAGDSMDTLKLTNTANCSPEVKEMLGQISHALERIQANVMQGSEVVKGMLKYSRTGSENFESLNLDQIIEGTLEMVQFKVKLSEIDIVRDYPKETPKIHGNLAQLEEVFFNFIDNAYDAIVERRTTLKEAGFRGRVTISAHPKDTKLEITIEDNGMGVKDDDNKKLFTPFFTTKSSARTKGTGLGLYVINKIITEAHKGKISFESDYKVGTRFIVELPLAK